MQPVDMPNRGYSIIRFLSMGVLKSIYVEPVGFFCFFGLSIYRLCQAAGMYEKLCHMYFEDDPQVNCNSVALKATTYAEDFVQARSTEWNMYTVMCIVIPALFTGLFLGEL